MFFNVGTVLKIKAMNLKYYSYYDPYLYERTRKNLIQKQNYRYACVRKQHSYTIVNLSCVF